MKKSRLFASVLFSAFAVLYWLAKEAVAKTKFFSLLTLFCVVGVDKMQHFNHKSHGAMGEMSRHIGTELKNSTVQQVK